MYYPCPHCGVPTTGRVIGKIGKKEIRQMCKACNAYIGSPAARQKGATMNNRIEMEQLYKKASVKRKNMNEIKIPRETLENIRTATKTLMRGLTELLDTLVDLTVAIEETLKKADE